MTTHSTFLYWLIVGCEASFWLVLVLALSARYLLRREQLSRALLLSLPAIDLLLFAFTGMDLKGGTPATFAHGLAAAYVGFTIAFGSIVVRWADQRFAHWFSVGPPPSKAPTYGWPSVWYELKLWFRSIVAWVMTLILVSALIAFVGNPAITEPLHQWFRIALVSTFFWLIFGPGWCLMFVRRKASI